ncbi:putative OsmC-like protein [Paraburkholderia youngii]
MPLATASTRLAADAPNYLVSLEAGSHTLAGDEGPHEGGQNRGPAPFEFVLAGLAACTSATLRMYM